LHCSILLVFHFRVIKVFERSDSAIGQLAHILSEKVYFAYSKFLYEEESILEYNSVGITLF